MGEVLLYSQRQATEVCCSCGIVFSMPEEVLNRRRGDKKSFFCPNGHSQAYTGESDQEKISRLAREANTARAALAHTDKLLSAERAARKRAAARIAKGVCPKCNRTFGNVARHMSSKHGEPHA